MISKVVIMGYRMIGNGRKVFISWVVGGRVRRWCV